MEKKRKENRGLGSGIERGGSSLACPSPPSLLAVCPWRRYCTALKHSFLLCKQWQTPSFSQSGYRRAYVSAKSLQLCLTLCNPRFRSPPCYPVHGDSSGKNTAVGCHALLQGIFPTQGSNPRLMSPALAGGFFTTSATQEVWVQVGKGISLHCSLSKP